jgi:hypothetical protein
VCEEFCAITKEHFGLLLARGAPPSIEVRVCLLRGQSWPPMRERNTLNMKHLEVT